MISIEGRRGVFGSAEKFGLLDEATCRLGPKAATCRRTPKALAVNIALVSGLFGDFNSKQKDYG